MVKGAGVKIAIVGMGSIGKRHYSNIEKLGHTPYGIDIGDTLNFNVDCAFICSPTKYHLVHSLEYLKREIPVFIEKPLTYRKEDLKKFIPYYKHPISMVGCNMRFHPAVRSAKDFINKNKVIFVRAEFGYYLPFWRKGDYRKSYSASEDGGVILDAIHEIDYLFWLFGSFKDIRIACSKISDLDIKREDIAELSIIFDNGVSASVHLDYLLRSYHRKLEIVSNHQSIKFNISPTNLCFKKEVLYFIDCVQNNKMPMNNIMEASYVLEKVLEWRKEITNGVEK